LKDSPSSVALSEIASSVEIIKLETNDEAIIGQMSTVAFADSLLLVYSSPPSFGSQEGGLFVFDSKTGDFKYRLPRFMDRGPLGYNSTPRPLVVDGNKILLNKWSTYGLWDFTTKEMLDDDVPLGSGVGFVHFLDNASVIVDRLWVDPGTPDKVEVLSTLDGSVIRGLGQATEIDQTEDGNSGRSRMYRFGDDFSYYSMVCDTIYGINRSTFEFYPRFVLNLKHKLYPDVKGGIFAPGYILAEAICESERYLFITYLEESQNGSSRYLVCYDKKDNQTMYVGNLTAGGKYSGFENDQSSLPVMFFPQNVTSDGRAYCVVQAVDIVTEIGEERATAMGISEDDNPVIVIATLKN
jgi:hypothetical protein